MPLKKETIIINNGQEIEAQTIMYPFVKTT